MFPEGVSSWNIYGDAPDGEAGRRRGTESFGSDDVGTEGQCTESDGRGSGFSGDRVSVKGFVTSRILEPEKYTECIKSG